MTPRTASAAVTITCPPWCIDDAQHHADELWNQGGCVLHRMEDIEVKDPDGFPQGLGIDTVPADSISVGLSTNTTPDNRPQSAPVIYLEGHDLTIRQAEQLASALLTVVDLAKLEHNL